MVKVKVEVRVAWLSNFAVELPHECVHILVNFFHLVNVEVPINLNRIELWCNVDFVEKEADTLG